MKWFVFIVTMVYLAVMAVIDLHKKEIPCVPGGLCLICLIVGQLVGTQKIGELLLGMLIGLFLWGISKVTKGGIGEGDALVYTVTGTALGFWGNFELLIISLLLASIVSLWLLVIKKKGRKYKIPFIPFTAAAYGVVFFL